MPELSYSIDERIFARFPGYVRGVVLAFGVTNGPSPGELVALLRAAEGSLHSGLDLSSVAEHPRIKSWRAAFRAFGAKPSEFRSSVEAMARRVLRGDPLPTINALVDIGNVISLQYLAPAGAHAIDGLGEDLWLRPASGTETFTALDGSAVEHPEPGEIIFAEGHRVLTRRWVWRQGTATLVQVDTTAIELNVDGLPPVPLADVAAACEAAAGLIRRFCGGRTRWEVLSPGNPCIRIRE